MMTSAEVAALTADYLVHSCTLLAPGAVVGYDPYGEALAGPDTATPGVPCWCYQPPAAGELVEPGRALVAHTWRVNVAPDAGATEDWQVTDVREAAQRDADGNIVTPGRLIVAGPLAITEVIRHRGHLTLVCSSASREEVAP